MRRGLLCGSAAMALTFLALQSAPAYSSADTTCYPSYTARHGDLTGCDNMALLGPGNDTRVNLLFLLLDKYPQRYKFAGYDVSPSSYEVSMQGNSLFSWDRLSYGFFRPAETKSEDEYSYGDRNGTRCASYASGTTAFETAITSAKLVSGERSALIAARRAMQPECGESSNGMASLTSALGGVSSGPGREFASYLQGAQAFYDGDFATAGTRFGGLQASSNGWLREAARYMVGRAKLNAGQATAFGEWGDLERDKVDRSALSAAEVAFQSYLKDYPDGQYAASARGLLRRIYWLGGQQDKLSAEYMALLADPSARNADTDDLTLIDEMDIKLLPGAEPAGISDTTLLAIIDLKRMRRSDDGEAYGDFKPISKAELDGQRKYFVNNAALYEYLQAAYSFFVANRPADVVKAIPDAAKQDRFSYLQFSRQMLRGLALDAVKDRNARGFWLQMLGGAKQPYQRAAIELALAQNLERNNALSSVFDPAMQITDNAIRETLLEFSAGPALLRQQAGDSKASAHERDVALFTLLYKQLTRGAYADFIGDLKRVPSTAPAEANFWNDLREGETIPLGIFNGGASKSGYVCPSVRTTATALAQNPKSAMALLCLGDFVRTNGLDGFSVDRRPEAHLLGGVADEFPGKPFERLEAYKSLIANPATPANEKAYALYRAVNCYAPSGNNSCNGIDVDQSVRKGWFNQLKKNYPQSTWAKSLKYYW